ncbi:protein STICHEL [Arachis stenosperma]|uniref:protein STICHEL n=1 Tax=Arachis stenosperma TaxID=217475 RepID=UPI0025AB9D11|nr:protein STICHEL [Arachis stenosperma]XP_057738536.1 protein STICHEL [Arachis stenosperma]XP_057738537.1 protein STICHEL [Arachis stenosperma]
MSEMASKLHLKKELTQIRKAARVLRDPGTTSSWKSPLNSSRSASVSAWNSAFNNVHGPTTTTKFTSHSQLDSHVNSVPPTTNKRVFLYNWKTHKSSSDKNDRDQDEEEEEDAAIDGSSSLLGSFEDTLSDAHNVCDSKSDTYLGAGGGGPRSSSIFRCGDTNLISLATPSARRTAPPKKKSKKPNSNTLSHLDPMAKFQHRDTNLNLGRKVFKSNNALLEGLPPMPFTRDDSMDHSDDTEDYSNSEDVRQASGSATSPLLLKLKRKNWSRSSSKLLRTSRKEDSSYSYSTPALSTSSYNRYGRQYPSTVGSWDGTTTSMNDGDDEIDDRLDLPGRQGCGIPCYWSKRTPKHRGMCGSCYSPSLSDTLRRKGSSILCGGQTIYPRHRRSSSATHKRRMSWKSAQGVIPLLTNGGDGRIGSSIGTGRSDDELSTNFGELDLEGLSRLDGRRWSSSCRSQEGLEIIALNGEGVEEEDTPENSRSFSQKYRPIFFSELIGQNIVVQSLMNAVSRGRIAPVYLFQGPRGTGKTSTARIFAAALNCVALDESKPCGYCRECTDFISGKSSDLLEVDGTNKKGIDKARYLLKRLSVGSSSASTRYTVFVIDECHLLPSKAWLGFLKFLEEPPQRVVFIFITSDLDNVPRTIQSRCQKYLFNKIKDVDIVNRLRKISAQENLDVEEDALDLIATNADGSLRDAETMLEQLSLLGKRISTSLVNELVGVVSDEKLLELLELAMSSNTAETVKRARELMDSGVDPMVLMSQLAGLIMDIIAGSYTVIDSKPDEAFFGGRSLNDSELERLKHSLKLLSEAEKQLRTSSERSTWFTATLLQLGSMSSPDLTQSGSSRRQSCKTTDDDPSSASREVTASKHMSDLKYMPWKSISPTSQQKAVNGNSGHQRDISSNIDGLSLKSKPSNSPVIDDGSTIVSSDDIMVGNMMYRCVDSGKLHDIWARCIGRCHSKTLRQLLLNHGKLVSICEVEGVLVAYVAFGDGDIKLRADRFSRSITNSMEMVLRRNVDVRIIHLPDGVGETQVNMPRQAESALTSEKEQRGGRGNGTDPLLDGNLQSAADSSDVLGERNGVTERRQDNPMQRIESIIREQRLETAWLQAVEKGSPGSLSRLRPEKNQVLPQEGIYCIDPMESTDSARFSSQQHWEDEQSNDVKILNVKNGRVLQKDQTGRRYPMSPSLLHGSSLAASSGKDNPGYESSSGAGGCGFLCWNKAKPRRVVKVRGGTPVGARKVGRFPLFGDCGKHKKRDVTT